MKDIKTYSKVLAQQNKVWTVVGYVCKVCDNTYKHENKLHNHVCKPKEYKRIEQMPIHRITKNGEVYYRWGDQGKLYKDRKDAEAQARAAYASGYKEPKKDMKDK